MSKREIAYELHKPARKNFTRRRVNVYGKNDLWQADLVEMIPYSKINGGYKYFLVVIDCYTKFSWSIPLRNKSGKEVSSAMATILRDRSPKLLQVDNGKEFYNTIFDALMTKYGIHKYSIVAIVEVQCILGAKNKYFIKEMSIVDTATWATQHWIFKNSKTMQDNKSRKTNKWLEHNYHKLTIEYGDVEYEELSRILNSLKFTCIYVKGEQKKQMLAEFIPQVALFFFFLHMA
ncbi:unnamed protein product [Macrosiphum euphorbiae]|uniref:Integrase catalytic domain-containing protein n=1 Tax=Macrosiphum euphorbiae TaxID=13131 RepID=A0AAV0WNV6_9HEMI|nr:unnamed protein product [Macrosiphum euphorbiae]